ncbi:hypothetical protein H0H87_007040 [Tephrocybe sp. NHM501043]|nr:hypothetical protein H0H87_007040 [Tephrocybe sp. NHM501043]
MARGKVAVLSENSTPNWQLVAESQDARIATPRSSYIVAQLPKDVLGEIFTQLVVRPLDGYLRPRRLDPKRAPDWTVVTFVCSRWRRIALDTSTLWCYINIPESIARKPWLEATLARSQPALLDIDIYVHNDASSKIANLALEEIHRARELSIDLQHNDGILYLSFMRPAPNLERLRIRADDMAFRQPIFGGDTPQLRYLHLDGIRTPLDSSRLSRLTTLKLHNVGHMHPTSLSLNEFVTSLSTMSTLFIFQLFNACPPSTNHDVDLASTYPAVQLPQLRSLRLNESTSACTTLLARLAYPDKTVSHDIQTFIDNEEWPRFQDAYMPLSRLSTTFSPMHTKPVRCLRIFSTNRCSLHLEAWCDEAGNYMDCPTSTPSTIFKLNWDYDNRAPEYHAQRLIERVWAAFSLQFLETLHVENIPLEPDTWKAVFGSILTLQNIALEGLGASNLMETVKDSGRYFVNLQNLVARDWKNYPPATLSGTNWFDAIETWLSVRCTAGNKIGKVVFRTSEVPADFVERLHTSAATKLAHNSTIPALGGNNDLKPLQDLILAEKQVLTSLQKLSSDLAKSAEALRIWGSGEGDDLGDILGTSSTLIALWATAVSQFAAHGHPMRDYLKSIRTREENLDELKRRRRSLGAKAEAAEKKLSKMSPEHKNLMAQTDSLNALRVEIRSMDSQIMTEEAALGDFKRSTTRAWMGLKFGGMLECSEKGMIAGEFGKLIIAEIPEEQTQPGMARSLYYGRTKTEQLLSEAHRCINEVVMSTVPSNPNPQRELQQPHIQQQPAFQVGLGFQSPPQLPISTPQSTFEVPGVAGQTPQHQWSPPQQPNDHYSPYLPAPQGLGTGQFFDQGSPAPGSPTHQRYPSGQNIQTNAPYQAVEEQVVPPPHSVDDFGVNTSSPGLGNQQGQAAGGRFATFPVKNRGYALNDPQAQANRDSDSFSTSVAQALSSSQSPPGTEPQPSFSYQVSHAQGYVPPSGPPVGAAAPPSQPGQLGPHQEERNVYSDDEGGLAYMAGSDDHHDNNSSRHVRFEQMQNVDEELERRSYQAPDPANAPPPQDHPNQDRESLPSPDHEHQPPQYEAIPPLNDSGLPTQTGTESGNHSPSTDTRFQTQRRVPPPTFEPADDERSLNAAAAREVSRELDILHFNPPTPQQERTSSGSQGAPGYGGQNNEPLAPPQTQFSGGEPSPNSDSPTLPYPSYNTPPTNYEQPKSQAPYPQENNQYQNQISRPSYDLQSGGHNDNQPRLPPLTTQTTPSPYQTPYGTPGDYPRGLGTAPSPVTKSSTSLHSQVPAGARTISAAAFKRPQRMVSGEIPPSLVDNHSTSPLSVKKRLPSSPYPQGRESSPSRRGRSGSPAQPAAPAPSQALPPIPKEDDDYDYLSAYVDPGAPQQQDAQRGRTASGGYGDGRFATNLEGGLR